MIVRQIQARKQGVAPRASPLVPRAIHHLGIGDFGWEQGSSRSSSILRLEETDLKPCVVVVVHGDCRDAVLVIVQTTETELVRLFQKLHSVQVIPISNAR